MDLNVPKEFKFFENQITHLKMLMKLKRIRVITIFTDDNNLFFDCLKRFVNLEQLEICFRFYKHSVTEINHDNLKI